MNIYISGRQFGKTTMLIKESARTGATIAVANYQMVEYVQYMASWLELDIPQPVTYAEVFKTYRENKTKRYLVDELQMMLSQLNVDIATVDLEPIQYLNHWKYPEFDLKKQKELVSSCGRQTKMLNHIRRWNIWRKHCLNGPIHKILVLFGAIKSPTMPFALLPEEEQEMMDAFQRSLKGENDD